MSDRGMKKWAPYKALNEQAPALQQTRMSKIVIEKPLISNEEAEDINYMVKLFMLSTIETKRFLMKK